MCNETIRTCQSECRYFAILKKWKWCSSFESIVVSFCMHTKGGFTQGCFPLPRAANRFQPKAFTRLRAVAGPLQTLKMKNYLGFCFASRKMQKWLWTCFVVNTISPSRLWCSWYLLVHTCWTANFLSDDVNNPTLHLLSKILIKSFSILLIYCI